MVIYATEFMLWCGVFACGGYFNLIPYIKQQMNARRERKREEGVDPGRNGETEREPEGVSHDIQLHPIPSSTSVFRTPSSAASLSEALDAERRVIG